MKTYFVIIEFDKALLYQVEVKARNKIEAYAKAKAKLARQIFKSTKLKQYDINEI